MLKHWGLLVLVDSKALIKALKENWIAGAGLDVYEAEPNLDPEFLSLEDVTLLPHMGSSTETTRIAMGIKCWIISVLFLQDKSQVTEWFKYQINAFSKSRQ